MAIYDPDFTCCSICDERVYESDDFVATTHFIGDPDHPLFRHSDACIHRQCFLAWEHRKAFVAEYNHSGMEQWHKMLDDGTIIEKSFLRQAFDALLGLCHSRKR